MKKPHFPLVLLITLVFLSFTAGFFVGRNINAPEILITAPVKTTPPAPPSIPTEENLQRQDPSFPININIATKEQLMQLPGIGQTYASKILEYRRLNGKFDTPEDLLNVEGIGISRLEDILDLITTGG